MSKPFDSDEYCRRKIKFVGKIRNDLKIQQKDLMAKELSVEEETEEIYKILNVIEQKIKAHVFK